VGVDPCQLTALLITHEHHDHIKGLKLFLKHYSLPLFGSEESLLCAGISEGNLDAFTPLQSGISLQIGSLEVAPFSLPHDAVETYGFNLRSNGMKLSYATDLGFASKLIREKMKDSGILIIEANHDMGMLTAGPYPWFLKQRVMSRRGHLSNASMGKLVGDVIRETTRFLVLAHLSEVNNSPDLARREALSAASKADAKRLKIIVSSQNTVSELIQL
jgi:phosphoribosyl 1,2-cyclic phosphodiesterase